MNLLLQTQIGVRRPVRAVAIAIPAAALFSIVVAAQEQGRGGMSPNVTSPLPATGTPAPQAPVGHRQPTMSTLPPAVRKEEETGENRARDNLGPVPSICSRC